jgi:hypothetical protein
MRSRRALTTTTALALSVGVAFAPLATAQQQEPKLEVTPSPVNAERFIEVSTGPCETFSTVTSPGFREPIALGVGPENRLSGMGVATAKPGSYTATVQCDGKTLTAPFTVLPFEILWHLYRTEVEPGGTIIALHGPNTGCRPLNEPRSPMRPLYSRGFAAPLTFGPSGHLGQFYGQTTVITTPGVYEVVAQCQDRPERSVKTFRILGTPPTTTPPSPGKPKPPITKPKGAPDTGGGGTA